MTAASWCWLAVTGAFALGDWIACARGNRVAEYVCKPATLVAMIGLAIALVPGPGQGATRVLFVLALVCSLTGDVFLMLPSDRFVAGLAAFLLAHLLYVAGFLVHAPAAAALLAAAVVVVVVVLPLALRIGRAVREQDSGLLGPVVAYIVVISTMLTVALASGNPLVAVGGTLFVASDAMIAWGRFVRPFPGASVAIMVTYHLGQLGLVLSLVR